MVRGNSILIACSCLEDLAGAEITTLELAEAFIGLEWTVSVASFSLSDEIRPYVDALGVSYYNLADDNAINKLTKFDLVWVHHSVAAYRLLTDSNLKLERFIYYSLSHFAPLECPPVTKFIASKYLVNSQENLEHFRKNYPDLKNSVVVLNNSVLSKYWNGVRLTHNPRLQRLAVVTNHPTNEVRELINILKLDGVYVDVFGNSGKKVRVFPDMLSDYDAVLTIGKTVQYAIASCTPVYCYDHFGGDGWITPENFHRALKYNFSGRGGRGTVSSDVLKRELYEGYHKAVSLAQELYDLGERYFITEKNLNKLLVDLIPYHVSNISLTDKNLILRQVKVFAELRREISYRDKLVSDLKSLLDAESDNARAQILYRDELIDQLEGQIRAEKDNARAQIIYRDELIAQLESKIRSRYDNILRRIIIRVMNYVFFGDRH